MTDIEANNIIQSWHGWYKTDKGWYIDLLTGPYHRDFLQDYCRDENLFLVRDAEARLPSFAIVEDYQMRLAKITVTFGKLFKGGTQYPADGFLFHASAQQRSHALADLIKAGNFLRLKAYAWPTDNSQVAMN